METNQYECSHCHGVFEKGWSDEEAAGELSENFPGFTPAACDVVCDDCYQKIMGWAKDEGLVGSQSNG